MRVSVEKRQQRAQIWETMKALDSKAKAEQRSMSAEEEAQWQAANADIERLGKEVDAEEAESRAQDDREAARQARLEQLGQEMRSSVGGRPVPNQPQEHADAHRSELAPRQFRAKLLQGGGFTHRFECRQVTAGKASEGGYMLQPDAFMAEWLKDVDNEVFIRKLSRVFSVDRARAVHAPTVKTRMAAPAWVGELSAGTADSTLAFGRRTLYPHALALKVYISKTLLGGATIVDPERAVRDEITYVFGITAENCYLNGTGSSQPLGVFTASDLGVSTSRDVSSASSGVFGADDFIGTLGSLKEQYARNAVWVMHRDMKTRARKLKAGDGHYLWVPGVLAGGSLSQGPVDTLEGRPVYTSEYAPSTYSSGYYAAILGDFSKYWIVDALDMQIEKLMELRADYNEVQFNVRYEGDGAPVREEAFARLKLS